eukprot:CAMPEP_0113640042 /NCGR_PEP_ID=MMETSP0017_2-20120614/21013_1 /TAXON_ID=2856 /ORGANISM="Cylindrotheca closterium" /LENGTH=146 /DNA_ID=CAMNT_0000551299 /DNA_START=62 /DNA_END=502 /DNA_ORIENTATION=+ /assembly_acc=CAM_ASM_000147
MTTQESSSPSQIIPMTYSTPQRVVSQVPRKRRSGSSMPSIGLPSSYPASPNMIAFEIKKASEDSSIITRNNNNLSQDTFSSLDYSMMMDHDSISSIETTTHPLHSDSSSSCSHSAQSTSHRRRQRNRALSDMDFAAMMDDFSTYVI